MVRIDTVGLIDAEDEVVIKEPKRSEIDSRMLMSLGFVAAIRRLGYTPHNAHELLGIARSTVFKICNGSSKVPPVVERLLYMYERHGIPGKKK